MKKLFLLIIITCIASLGAWAQTSSVSATITDSTSQAYANGTYDILFRPAPGVPGTPTRSGSTFTQHFSGVLDSSGAFAVTLTRNDFIQPGGSQWTFTICPLAASACFTSNQTIAAASVNLTTPLHTVTPLISVFSLGNIPSAYSSSEIVVTPNPGSFFWNLTTGTFNFWNGASWTAMIVPTSNITFTGTNSFTGSNTFTLPILWNPTGTALTAAQPGFPATNAQAAQFLGVGSNNYFGSPALYISRVDTTPYSVGNCFIGPLAACDAPLIHVEATNQLTVNTAAVVGVECDIWGMKSNGFGSPPFAANYNVCYGAELSDAAVDNIADLRGANLIVNVFGLPTHTGTAGFTRSAVGLEVDTNNSSGVDAQPFSGSAATGNYEAGLTINHNGPNSASAAIAVASSASSGKGYECGMCTSAITQVGHGSYVGGSGSFSPVYDFVAESNSTVGFLCGKGTTGTSFGTNGNPSTCVLLDAQGTVGNSETVNSGVLTFRAKNASTSGTDWQVQHIAGDALRLTLIGAANYFKFGNTGNFILSGSTGQHINTFSANNDTVGVLAVSASTSGSKTFTTNYASAPSCTITPTTDPTAVGVFWVTTSTSAVTANVKTSGTINFTYHCVGNPN